MYNAIPRFNKLCVEFQQQKERQIYKVNLQNATSLVNSKKPQTLDLAVGYHLKKVQNLEDKYTEIERENRILLEKISSIMNKTVTTSKSKSQKGSVLARPFSHDLTKSKNFTHSLNEQNRKHQLVKISIENQAIGNRIRNRSSHYQTKRILQDGQKQQQLASRISEYKYQLGNFQQSQDQNIQQQQNSLTNSKIERYESNNHPQNQNQNIVDKPQSKEKPYRIGNKFVLFKDTVQRNTGIFMVEVIVEGSQFKISAEQFKGDLSRIIEMSRQDGLKVLKTMFNGDISLLIDNLVIEDKLHIKGLEDYEI